MLIATAPGLFGAHWGRGDPEEELLIRMERDWTLAVRVLDPRHRPVAGAIVWGEANNSEPGVARRRVWLGTTGADGRWSRKHAQTEPMLAAGAGALLSAMGVGVQGEPVLVEPETVTDEVLLRIPATGAVIVRAEEADGTPLDPAGQLWMEIHLTRAEGGFGLPISYQRELRSGGAVRFDCVGLGQRLRATLEPVGAVLFDGPTEPGQLVEVTIRDVANPVLVGSLRWPDGSPLAATEVSLRYENDAAFGGANGRTDAEGRFRLRPGTGPIESAAAVSTRPPDAEVDAPLWRVDLEPREFHAGENDLGTIAVVPATRLASGWLEGVSTVDPERVRSRVRVLVDRFSDDLETVRVRFDADARFVIEGVAAADARLTLAVTGDGFRSAEPVPFRVGTDDLGVPVRTTADVEVGILVDDRRARDAVRCVFVPTGPRDGRARVGSSSRRESESGDRRARSG